jgi:hypothetical protein
MLGMIFGVGAVIAMLSIGAGAERESLRIIENFGIRNIIIQAKEFKPEELKQIRTESLGLALRDVDALRLNAADHLVDATQNRKACYLRARREVAIKKANWLQPHPAVALDHVHDIPPDITGLDSSPSARSRTCSPPRRSSCDRRKRSSFSGSIWANERISCGPLSQRHPPLDSGGGKYSSVSFSSLISTFK